MKVAIITDTHFGGRSDSKIFSAYFERFYDDIFFPYLEENNISRVIHCGDIFDRRKYVNFQSLYDARRYVFEPLRKYHVDLIVGNHDTSLKATNEINSPELLLAEYSNIIVHKEATDIDIDGVNIAVLPWVCADNYQSSMQFLQNTKSEILFGHLEIQGFEMHIGSVSNTGFDQSIFQKFDRVYSGHFHHKSTRGNITYLGSPYEMTWADYNDPRGFHVFDTDTRELTFVKNPYRIFYKLEYDDSTEIPREWVESGIFEQYHGTYVKLIIENKLDPLLYEQFIGKLEAAKPADITCINNQINLEFATEVVNDSEDASEIISSTVMSVHKESLKVPLHNLLSRLHNDAINIL